MMNRLLHRRAATLDLEVHLGRDNDLFMQRVGPLVDDLAPKNNVRADLEEGITLSLFEVPLDEEAVADLATLLERLAERSRL